MMLNKILASCKERLSFRVKYMKCYYKVEAEDLEKVSASTIGYRNRLRG